MVARRDYYEILGVGRTAPAGEIKKAYRKLARKHHPDVNPGDTAAEEKFKEIQEAYSVLGNKEKRGKYDQFGHAAFGPGFEEQRGGAGRQYYQYGTGGAGGAGAGGFEDFGDLFGDFFSRTRTRPQPRGPEQGEDLEYGLDVDFLTAARGGTVHLSFQREDSCESCGGSGIQPGTVPQTCPQCGGAGTVNLARGPIRFSQACPQCGGAGTIIGDPCRTCGGRGRVMKPERIQVRIPEGVNTGSRIRLSGKGGPGLRGGPPGDLYIVVQVAEHPYFRREKDDIYLEVPVSISEATLGGKVVIPTLDGRTSVSVPPGIRSGQKLRLAGKGIKHMKGSGHGDQYAVIQIVPPRKLEEKARKLMEEFAAMAAEDPRAAVKW
jgi:molecular chaperone DnaJ